MRNPDRIPEILAKLEVAWQKSPDMRLGQLLSAIAYKHKDFFYVEEDEWDRLIDKFITETPDYIPSSVLPIRLSEIIQKMRFIR